MRGVGRVAHLQHTQSLQPPDCRSTPRGQDELCRCSSFCPSLWQVFSRLQVNQIICTAINTCKKKKIGKDLKSHFCRLHAMPLHKGHLPLHLFPSQHPLKHVVVLTDIESARQFPSPYGALQDKSEYLSMGAATRTGPPWLVTAPISLLLLHPHFLTTSSCPSALPP